MRAFNTMAAAFAAAGLATHAQGIGNTSPPAGSSAGTVEKVPGRHKSAEQLHIDFRFAQNGGHSSEVKANILGRLATASIDEGALQNVPGYLAGQAVEGSSQVDWQKLPQAAQLLGEHPHLRTAFYVEVGTAIGMLEKAASTAATLKALASLREFGGANGPEEQRLITKGLLAYRNREPGALTSYEALQLEGTGNRLHVFANREELQPLDGNAVRAMKRMPTGKLIRGVEPS